MGWTLTVMDDVRKQIAPDDAVLSLARERRDAARAAATRFGGVLRTFASGSLAHGTANCPIHQRDKGLDGDSGAALDRRVYRDLGPDVVGGEGPNEIVEQMRRHLERDLRRVYPLVKLTVTKRAIFVEFNDPLPSGEDPTVDLVVGLTRRDEPGLWIPNTERNWWDASDPEEHTSLLTADPQNLRVLRARMIRLAKAENKKTAVPPLSSFNLEAFGLMFVERGKSPAEALLALWGRGASDLRRRLTPDPAGVSDPIKVVDRDEAIRRLSSASMALSTALANDDDERTVRRELAKLWPDFVDLAAGTTKARIAAGLRAGRPLAVTAAGALSVSGIPLKQPRAFGVS